MPAVELRCLCILRAFFLHASMRVGMQSTRASSTPSAASTCACTRFRRQQSGLPHTCAHAFPIFPTWNMHALGCVRAHACAGLDDHALGCLARAFAVETQRHGQRDEEQEQEEEKGEVWALECLRLGPPRPPSGSATGAWVSRGTVVELQCMVEALRPSLQVRTRRSSGGAMGVPRGSAVKARCTVGGCSPACRWKAEGVGAGGGGVGVVGHCCQGAEHGVCDMA